MTSNPQTALAIFLAVLVVGLACIYVWSECAERRRLEAEERRQIELTKERARAALTSTPGTTFHNGALAAIDGDERWENPNCDPRGGPSQFSAWDGGWCYGRQMLRQMGGQP